MDQSSTDRQMYDATCAECGQKTQVPFQPSGDRPVYCQNCFRSRKGGRGGNDGGTRQMYDVTCSSCGNPAQVPFRPSGDRPVYCRDCFAKQRS